MGVNRASSGIISNKIIEEAAHQEIIRRYFRGACEYVMGLTDRETLDRADLIMKKVKANPEDRKMVEPAREAAMDARKRGKGHDGIYCGAAIELKNGTIVTGKNSPLMHSSASLVLNALKHLAGLPDKVDLLPANMIESLSYMKRDILNWERLSLNLDETLIVLGISALSDPWAKKAMEYLKDLVSCEVHLTHMPSPGDEAGLRKIQVNLTCDPEFSSKSLFISG